MLKVIVESIMILGLSSSQEDLLGQEVQIYESLVLLK
jgi:hypothetical protein